MHRLGGGAGGALFAMLADRLGWESIEAGGGGLFLMSMALDGYCSTIHGLHDRFEVDLGFPELVL